MRLQSGFAVTNRASDRHFLLEIAEPAFALGVRLVSSMNGIIEVDAGQDRKHIGLQKCHEQLKRSQRNSQC